MNDNANNNGSAAASLGPGQILNHAYGFWGSAVLAASIKHEVFDHLRRGAQTAAEVARRAEIPVRGAQAMLDGLYGMQLVENHRGTYRNSAASLEYLVPDSRTYLGAYADMIMSTMGDWASLPDVIASGEPIRAPQDAPDNPFWEQLVLAIAPLAFPPANFAATRLQIASQGPCRVLDIGGGAGPYAAVWLGINPQFTVVQVDFPNVNSVAREFVASFGVVDRFSTIDGDMERLPFEENAYDYAVYSHVAHGLSAEANLAMFEKIAKALKPAGTLIVAGFIPEDDRTGHPFALMFSANMACYTKAGLIHTKSAYQDWARGAGFESIEFQSLDQMAVTLAFATMGVSKG